jgi:hypothetical protein
MGALKPRGMLGQLEATKEGRSYVIRVPLEELGECLVLQLSADEARELGALLSEAGT